MGRKTRGPCLAEHLAQVMVLARNLLEVWTLLLPEGPRQGVRLGEAPGGAGRIPPKDLMGRPVHLGAVFGQPGMAQYHRGMRGVDYHEGDLLLVVPRDPEFQGNSSLSDPAEWLPIKRVGH